MEYNVFWMTDKLLLPVSSMKLLLVEKFVKQLKGLIIKNRPIYLQGTNFRFSVSIRLQLELAASTKKVCFLT